MSLAERDRGSAAAPADGSLTAVLDAWWRYAELRANGAPLRERIAAWEVLQAERRRHRAVASGR